MMSDNHLFLLRYPQYPRPRYAAHPKDCSVMTYRGHSVLRTLIRCHFSPTETTGAQYLYSGSADGRVHVNSVPYIVSMLFICLSHRYGHLMVELWKFWTVQKLCQRRSLPPDLSRKPQMAWIRIYAFVTLVGIHRSGTPLWCCL